MSQAFILIVEDDNNDEELTRLALGENNLDVSLKVVRDGIDALDFLFGRGKFSDRVNELPQVILLDLKLPKLSGLEVLKTIRENPATRLIPVVVFTSSKEESDINMAYELGANAFVQKPINFADFSSAIQQIAVFWVLFNRPYLKT